MTSSQLADSSRFGASLATASDAAEHQATIAAAIQRLASSRHETTVDMRAAELSAFCS